VNVSRRVWVRVHEIGIDGGQHVIFGGFCGGRHLPQSLKQLGEIGYRWISIGHSMGWNNVTDGRGRVMREIKASE
jgi:hypothetical protein